VTVVVLGFAAVGVAAVGGGLFKKLTGLALAPPKLARPAAPVIYQPLAKDDAVLINIAVSPPGARLMLDGEPLPSNPVRLPRGPRPHTLAAAADGFAPTVEEFTADKPKTVHLRLPRTRR
jgi:PEGA domain-containing protein